MGRDKPGSYGIKRGVTVGGTVVSEGGDKPGPYGINPRRFIIIYAGGGSTSIYAKGVTHKTLAFAYSGWVTKKVSVSTPLDA